MRGFVAYPPRRIDLFMTVRRNPVVLFREINVFDELERPSASAA